MERLFWIDIETTGLDPQHDHILQIAYTLGTFDGDYSEIQQVTLNCDNEALANMNDWCKQTHANNGILQSVLTSNITVQQAEQEMIKYLNNNTDSNDTLYFAGSSVHFDKAFIQKWMPTFIGKFSHRVFDISCISLLCRHLQPINYSNRPVKRYQHTAQSDIMETIEEYKFYLNLLK